ncbi:MAG: hypothetical protein VZS44_08745 [Bacilli bacterium]|nr:hypothetical protein [Bacilli bacterium]
MEILDLKVTIILYVRNINFQIAVVKYNSTNERAGLRWRVDYKDSDCDHGSTTIDDGDGIRINNHDYLNYKSKGLFLLSNVIGFPKTYRKIIIIFLREQESFWSEYTYRTIFNSLNSIIKNKYDCQRFN